MLTLCFCCCCRKRLFKGNSISSTQISPERIPSSPKIFSSSRREINSYSKQNSRIKSHSPIDSERNLSERNPRSINNSKSELDTNSSYNKCWCCYLFSSAKNWRKNQLHRPTPREIQPINTIYNIANRELIPIMNPAGILPDPTGILPDAVGFWPESDRNPTGIRADLEVK